jgi:DNA-binding response OmpR family regulator
VLLCEHDPHLSRILMDAFQDEQFAVTPCASLEEIERALTDHPKAIVVTDSWTDSWQPYLSASEREAILRLSERTTVLVTTGRDWAQRAAENDPGPRQRGVKAV